MKGLGQTNNQTNNQTNKRPDKQTSKLLGAHGSNRIFMEPWTRQPLVELRKCSNVETREESRQKWFLMSLVLSFPCTVLGGPFVWHHVAFPSRLAKRKRIRARRSHLTVQYIINAHVQVKHGVPETITERLALRLSTRKWKCVSEG